MMRARGKLPKIGQANCVGLGAISTKSNRATVKVAITHKRFLSADFDAVIRCANPGRPRTMTTKKARSTWHILPR